MDCKEKVKQKKSAGKEENVKRQRSFGKEDFYENEVKRQENSGKTKLCKDSVKRQQEADKVASGGKLRQAARQEAVKASEYEKLATGSQRQKSSRWRPEPDRQPASVEEAVKW